MCAGCTLLNVPICSSGMLCSANMHQFIQVIVLSSGAGAGSIIAWLTGRKKHADHR